MGVRPDPMPADMPVNRVTLTKAALVSAHTLTLVLTGKDKLVEKALKDGAFSLHPKSMLKRAGAFRPPPLITKSSMTQAARAAERRRIAAPTRPKPAIISAQLAGSGTALL